MKITINTVPGVIVPARLYKRYVIESGNLILLRDMPTPAGNVEIKSFTIAAGQWLSISEIIDEENQPS